LVIAARGGPPRGTAFVIQRPHGAIAGRLG